MEISHRTPQTRFLRQPEGRLAYDARGPDDGALVVLVPGMGDSRGTFRFQVDALADAGFRVVTMDLRGHGESDTTFTAYDDEALAGDLLALVEHLGTPAAVVGNSMGAGAAVIAAAQHPDMVTRLALVGGFIRNPPTSALMSAAFRVLTARPWVRMVWRYYLPSLYAGRKPVDHDAYLATIRADLAKPGHVGAFSATTRTSHAPAEAAAPRVTAPVLVLMGDLDPDFDPAAEARWIANAVAGPASVTMVEDAGHYPHAQRPDVVNPALLEFLRA